MITASFLAGELLEQALNRCDMLQYGKYRLTQTSLLSMLSQVVKEVAYANFDSDKEAYYDTRLVAPNTDGKFGATGFSYYNATRILAGTLSPAAGPEDVGKLITFFNWLPHPPKFYAGIITNFLPEAAFERVAPEEEISRDATWGLYGGAANAADATDDYPDIANVDGLEIKVGQVGKFVVSVFTPANVPATNLYTKIVFTAKSDVAIDAGFIVRLRLADDTLIAAFTVPMTATATMQTYSVLIANRDIASFANLRVEMEWTNPIPEFPIEDVRKLRISSIAVEINIGGYLLSLFAPPTGDLLSVVNVTVGNTIADSALITLVDPNTIMAPENLNLFDITNSSVIEVVPYHEFDRRKTVGIYRDSQLRWARYNRGNIELAAGTAAPRIGTLRLSAYFEPPTLTVLTARPNVPNSRIKEILDAFVIRLIAIREKTIIPTRTVEEEELQTEAIEDKQSRIDKAKVR